MHGDLPGLVTETSAAATCGACLHQLGVPAQFAIAAGAVGAVLVRALLDVARSAVTTWWARRRARHAEGDGEPAP